MKILITGGFGFIGSHLVAELGRDNEVDILDGFNKEYMSFKFIHRGTRGLEKKNDIEKRNRKLNINYTYIEVQTKVVTSLLVMN